MPKFNKSVTPPKPTPAVNEAGGKVFEMSERQKLINFALNATFQSSFYKNGNKELDELRAIVRTTKDPLFAAKLAVWARHIHGARPVSHVITGELIKRLKSVPYTTDFVNAVIYRPDDALEILAYYLNTYGKPIPNSFKRGVSGALAGFDEYQFAKYKRASSEVSLKDLVLLCHPRPSVKNHVAIEKLLNGTLKQVNTAQAKLSEAGKKETKAEVKEARKEALNELVTEKKLGYSALIVNFLDILQESDDEAFDKALDYMVNEKAIRDSLMYPLKYYILYKVLSTLTSSRYNGRIQRAYKAINKAIEIAFKLVPKFEGKKILVAQDISGSMNSDTQAIQHGAGKNAVSVTTHASEYAAMFSVAMLKSDNNINYCQFEDDANFVNVNTADSFMTLVNTLARTCGGTDMSSVFQLATREYKKTGNIYDMIVIITDNESWGHSSSLQSELNNYRRLTGRKVKLITWDLVAKYTNPFSDKDAVYLCGYSAKVFEALGAAINEDTIIEKQIEAIDFKKFIDMVAPWKGGKSENKTESKSEAKRKGIQKNPNVWKTKTANKLAPKALKSDPKKSYARVKKTLK